MADYEQVACELCGMLTYKGMVQLIDTLPGGGTMDICPACLRDKIKGKTMTTNNNNAEEVSRTGVGMVDAIMEEALQYCGQRMAIGDSFGVPPINHIIRLVSTVREQEAEVRRLRAVLALADKFVGSCGIEDCPGGFDEEDMFVHLTYDEDLLEELRAAIEAASGKGE